MFGPWGELTDPDRGLFEQFIFAVAVGIEAIGRKVLQWSFMVWVRLHWVAGGPRRREKREIL